MDGLRDLTALVTGGGRGLGAEICRVLAEAGAVVTVADVRLGGAKEVADALASCGHRAWPLELDVTDADAARRAVLEVERREGRLDLLINNAGTDVTLPLDELTVEQWDRVLDVNLRGAFLMARHAFPGMKARGSGHIVNIVSTASRRAWPNASAYHASKWGLLGLSHALHVEARPHGVGVTAVIAGGMRTPFILERFPDTDPGLLQEPSAVAEAVRFALTQPAGTVVPELMVLPMRETSWP